MSSGSATPMSGPRFGKKRATRKSTAIIGLSVLLLSTFAPGTAAVADDPPVSPPAGDPGGKTVAESPSGSYIVVMAADPLVATVPAAELGDPAARAQIETLEDTHDAVLNEAGVATESKVQDYTNALNGFSAVMSYEDAQSVAGNAKVALVLPDELRQLTQESRPYGPGGAGNSKTPDALGEFLGLTGRGEAWKSGLTGEGVVVGVIDTGIWPEHPSFADDGTYPAPEEPLDSSERSTCDFGNTSANPTDAPFTCNNKLVGARQILDTYRALSGADPGEFDSARDDNGHGTHTASTAAGNANVQATIFGRDISKVSGIAPRARIIAYKALGNSGGYTSDLAAAIDQAVEDGVDVINYSVGGGAQLVSADTIAFLFAADAGVFSAVSAGNDGPGAATIGGPADVPWVTAVGANTQKQVYKGQIKLNGGPTINGASVTLGTGKLAVVDAELAGLGAPAESELCLTGTLDPVKVAGKIVLCKRGSNGRVAKSLEVFEAGGAGMILYNASDVDNLNTDNFYVPSVHIDYSDGLRVKVWLLAHGNAKATLVTGGTSIWPSAPSMAIFSSRGPNPTAADIIKPDITAPGVQILAGNTPLADDDEGPNGELFQAIAGTSMSSPVVAGIYALLKQAHPEWSAAQAKSAMMTTANTKVKDNDRKTWAGPFAMGAGQVDPGRVKDKGSAFNPGLTYDIGFNDYLGFLCDQGPELFANPASICAGLEATGISTVATNLNYPSIGISALAGSDTVTRTVTSVADRKVTFKAKVEAPQGYDVTVTPDRITLRPGETASYDVTITNNGGGPVDEWRTGALTWKGSGYKVRSAIAVQGLSLKAPTEVTGSGESGSATFDVQFGYTGDYTAAAHGLVSPINTEGIIEQDPDQTFPSADDGAGVISVPVDLTGAAYSQWDLNIPGDDDLDLYLIDPAGELIATSTNGGTAESISITLPEPGVYTLVIHGWAVPSDPLDITLQNWVISATPGGTLVLDSAPTAAVTGEVAPISVSWSNVPVGELQLGAVSHTGLDGLLALTLVAVQG